MKKFVIVSVLAAMFVGLFAACGGEDLQGSLRGIKKAADDKISFDMNMSADENGVLTGTVVNQSVDVIKRLKIELTVDGKAIETDQGSSYFNYEGGDELTFHSAEALSPGTHEAQMCLKNAEGESLKCTVKTLGIMEDEFPEED